VTDMVLAANAVAQPSMRIYHGPVNVSAGIVLQSTTRLALRPRLA